MSSNINKIGIVGAGQPEGDRIGDQIRPADGMNSHRKGAVKDDGIAELGMEGPIGWRIRVHVHLAFEMVDPLADGVENPVCGPLCP